MHERDEAGMPRRIQRQRMKGWRMPDGAVYVGRPSRWGNPYWHAQRFHGIDAALALYRNSCHGTWDPSIVAGWPTASSVYDEHRDWINALGAGHPLNTIRSELGGRDLACWCPVGSPCHADILLELANPTLPNEVPRG